MVMRKHQRYFPVYEASGEALLPHFITVANGQIDVPTVRAGVCPCTGARLIFWMYGAGNSILVCCCCMWYRVLLCQLT